MTVCGKQWQRMLSIPALVLGEDVLSRRIGTIIEAEQNVAVRQGKVGPQRQCLAQCCLRFGQPTLAHQRETEVVVRIGIACVAVDGVAGGLLGLPRMSRQRQHPGQIDPGIGEVWRNADCRAIAVGAFVISTDIAQDVAQVVVRARHARGSSSQRCTGGGFGVAPAGPTCAGSLRGSHAVRPMRGERAMAA